MGLLGNTGILRGCLFGNTGASLIEGGFVYAVGNKPMSAGYAKTVAYVGEN